MRPALCPSLPGAGLVLTTGCALTLALFAGLARLPEADQPAVATLVAAQSLMGIVWTTLYAWYAVASTGGPVLCVGMYLSAIAIALPAASLPVLGRLMLAAGLASAAAPLLYQGALLESGAGLNGGALLQSFLASLVLSVLLGAGYIAARTLAQARDRLRARNAELEASIERVTRRAERDHLTQFLQPAVDPGDGGAGEVPGGPERRGSLRVPARHRPFQDHERPLWAPGRGPDPGRLCAPGARRPADHGHRERRRPARHGG